MTAAAAEAPRLTLFGTAAVRFNADAGPTQQPFVSERLFQFAAFLAVRRAWVSRDQLTVLLWPDLPADSARRNLRKLIYRAQRQPWFAAEVRADALRWDADSDLRHFDTAIAAADWAHAVDCYGGTLLVGLENAAGKGFTDWLSFERARLAAAFRDAAARCCAQLADTPAARVDVAATWLQRDPFDEDALVVLVDALRASGRTAEASRAQQQFVQRLKDTLAVEPSARVLALALPLPAASTPAAAELLAADATLIGRRAEMQALAGLLERPECRVLTILGPGGIGKSRLARAAVAHLAPRYPDGIAWVGLADLSDITQVLWRAASAVGLDLAGASDPAEGLIDGLRTRRALIVLDNSEHLAALPALAARLLAACAGLQLLATSRARLEIEGEWLLPLDGLPCPDADETEPDALRAFDAVRLFEKRAHAASPTFDAPRNAVEVARLVRLVEGMPLAIELAAAWVRLLPVGEIADELAHSLDLLERAAPGLPDRLRSVRASFAHSWRLLAPREQEALARLAVFAGPFTRAAAAQVAEAELPVLAGLVDRSLLRADGAGRFSFHTLMRENAREQLDADPARAEVQVQRHAEFCVQVLGRLAVAGIGRKEVMQEVEFWLADCRAAWTWYVARADRAHLGAMTEPFMRFFEIKGRWSDGLVLIDAAEAALRRAHPEEAFPASMGAWRAAMLFRKGDTQGAIEASSAALERARKTRERRVMRMCLQGMGLAWWQQGAVRVARRCFERALAIAESLGDESGRAPHLHGIAMCAKSEGDYDTALNAYEQSLALYRASGSPQGEAMTLDNMALLERLQGNFGAARRYGLACLKLTDEHGLGLVRTYALVNLGLIAIDEREFDAARRYLEQAHAAIEAIRGGGAAVDVALASGRLALRTGALEAALPLLRNGLALARERLDEPSQLAAVAAFAEYHALCGARATAAAYFAFVLAQASAEASDCQDARQGLAGLNLSPEELARAEEAARALDVARLADRLLVAAP